MDTEADFAFFARVVDLLGARWTEASYREVMELRRGLAEVQPDGATFGPDPSVVPSLATNETGRSSP